MTAIIKKIKDRGGESIGEALVSLLIVVVGVILVASVVTSSARSMRSAENTMIDYYKMINVLEAGNDDTVKIKVNIESKVGDKRYSINGNETEDGSISVNLNVAYLGDDKSGDPTYSYNTLP